MLETESGLQNWYTCGRIHAEACPTLHEGKQQAGTTMEVSMKVVERWERKRSGMVCTLWREEELQI